MYNSPYYYAPYQYPLYAPTSDYKGQTNQPIQSIPQQPQAAQNVPVAVRSDILWVLNQNEADGYPVAPNCQAILWDKNAPTIYVKSVSANGIPSMRILDFTERSTTPLKSPTTHVDDAGDKYVTLEAFNDLRGDLDDLRAMYDKLAQKQEEKPKATTKKSQNEGE